MFLPHTGRHYFNPRSPHGERQPDAVTRVIQRKFQSTLPARGATTRFRDGSHLSAISIHAPRTGSDGFTTLMLCGCVNFNPRSPHGERPGMVLTYPHGANISIHAPRTGSDVSFAFNHMILVNISIHAPRTGSDCCRPCAAHQAANFNPRSPHGERRSRSARRTVCPQFQSTLPARGATILSCDWAYFAALFQSTLPARGATTPSWSCHRHRYFNPRSPHGERLLGGDISRNPCPFQSTLPARGATILEFGNCCL